MIGLVCVHTVRTHTLTLGVIVMSGYSRGVSGIVRSDSGGPGEWVDHHEYG